MPASARDAGSPAGGRGDCSGFDLVYWAQRPSLTPGLTDRGPKANRPAVPKLFSIME